MDLTGKRARQLLRVSTHGQDEDNQDAPTRDFITGRGMTIAGEPYKLRAKSARKGQQVAAVRQAIADYKAGAFDVLVVRAVDRLDRRGAIAGWALIGELWSAGVTVVSTADPELENARDDAMAEMSVSVKLSIARMETDAKVRRLADTFRRMDDSGSFRGCPPAGYKVEGEKYAKYLVPDEARAQMIRDAFTDATTGSTNTLAAKLGVTPDAIPKILRHPVYSTGRYAVHRADGVIVYHHCEPLVFPAVQAAAIAALNGRWTGDNVTSRAIAKDDLSGAVYCPCGASVGMHRYYNGGGHRKDGTLAPRVRRYRCEECGKSVRADDADRAVNNLMSSRTAPWLDRWLIPGNDHAAELERVRIEYRELSARGLDFDAEDAERDRLRGEIKRLEALPSVPARTETGFRRDDAGNILTDADRWASLDNAGRRTWLTSGEFRVTARAAAGRTGAVEVELEITD